MLEHALALAAKGFHVFPLRPNEKLPIIKDYPNRATRDPETIRRWWQDETRNIGISTSRFGDSESLCVIDVDMKNGKNGELSIFALDMEGFELPDTLSNSTPSGGQHMIYKTPKPLRQGADVLGSGVDVRSNGGYVVAPGSLINGKGYAQINGNGAVTEAPSWLVDKLSIRIQPANVAPVVPLDTDRASRRATEWLEKSAPIAREGMGGDETTYRVAARVKDFGCDLFTTWELLDEHWNDRCEPPWTIEELSEKVDHAFKYGKGTPGCDAPEAIFPPIEMEGLILGPPNRPKVETKGHPFDEINKGFALVKAGGFIIHETTDKDGNFTKLHMDLRSFHSWHENKPWAAGNEKPKPISTHWMAWAGRRDYDGIVFAPEQEVDPRWYNAWRGFSVKPVECDPDHKSLDAFLEHALVNVCGGNKEEFHWLMGYFAHMIQKPWEKPLTALVFKGAKGTGKNALLERVGHLLGTHFLVADDDRYLLSNFNAHLESCLFFLLDEASWAGDKRAEGKLKGLITGARHNIERKGQEQYRVDNLTRVAIIGNEKWMVPASQDERRFAVFNLGNGRRKDNKFFEDMRVGMEQGGYSHLLRYLLDFDLSGVDVNVAPSSSALTEQKHASLEPVQQWWLGCLLDEELSGGDWGGGLISVIPVNRMYEAFARWSRGMNIRSRIPDKNSFRRTMAEIAPSMKKDKKARDMKLGTMADTTYAYFSPGLEVLRRDWDNYIEWKVDWVHTTEETR